MLLAEDVAHQLAEAVDHRGMIDELRRRLDQAEGLHKPSNLVETAALLPQRGQDREPRLPRRRVACRHVHIGADAAFDQAAVSLQRAVAREIEQAVEFDDRLVDANRLRRRGKF